MKFFIASIALIFSILVFSCTSDNPAQKQLNPNGDSELALLMRVMYEDGMKIKEQIRQGKKPDVDFDFEKIHSAKATDPARMKTPDFEVFATSYVQAVQAFKAAKAEEAGMYYNGMVTACMNCHKSVCPGPTVRIKKMFLFSPPSFL